MCAYDTTIIDSLHQSHSPKGERKVPDCLQRNLLDNQYFPATSGAGLAVIISLCGIFLLTSLNRLNHTDLWGHLNFGRWIVQHGALPTADPFAAPTQAASFLNVPWLAQVAGYLVHQWLGPEGLILGHALLVTAACGVLMLAIRCRGTSVYWAVVGGVSYYVLSIPVEGTIRPQLFGMLGAALVLLACSLLPTRKHPLLWLPICFLLWTNLHGSYAMGIAMLGICCLGTTWSVWKETHSFTRTIADDRFRRLWVALALSLVACSVNPHGPLLLVNVLAFGKTSALAYLSEWRPLTPASFSGILFFGSLIVGAIVLRLADRRLEVQDVLMLGLFGLVMFTAIRMLAWWAVVWPWAIIPLADNAWRKWWPARSADQQRPPLAMTTVTAMGFVFMCLLLAPPSQSLISGRPRGIAATTSSDTPLFVAERLAQQKMHGRIYAPLDWADYLVWRGGQQIQPLVYSHVHLVHPDIFHQYQRIAIGDRSWLQLARSQKLKYLVISRDRNRDLLREVLLARQQESSQVRVVYQDQQAVIAELL